MAKWFLMSVHHCKSAAKKVLRVAHNVVVRFESSFGYCTQLAHPGFRGALLVAGAGLGIGLGRPLDHSRD